MAITLKLYLHINSLIPSGTYVLVNWVIIGWCNGLTSVQCQAINWTISPSQIHFSDIQSKIQCRMLFAKWWPFQSSLIVINSLALGRSVILNNLFSNSYQGSISRAFPGKLPSGKCTRPCWWPCWWLINIGSSYGLVPSVNKPLHEPNVDQVLWHHMASLGRNELTHPLIYPSPAFHPIAHLSPCFINIYLIVCTNNSRHVLVSFGRQIQFRIYQLLFHEMYN